MGDSTNIKRTRSGRLSHDPEPISGDPKDAGLVLLGPQASPEPGNPEGPRRFPFPVNHAALVTNHADASSREPPTAAWPHWAYGRSYLDAICIDRQRPALAAWERGDVHGTRGSIDSAPIGRAQRLSISIGTGRVIGGRGIAADVKRRMRRELAELKEMVRLGAGIPGDEQRIEMIKGLIAR